MKALFLDRDGVINEDYGHVHTKNRFKWRKGIFLICKLAYFLNHRIFVVTNQAGIGKGLYTTKQFLNLTGYMLSELSKKGINVEYVYYCPYHKDGIIKEFRKKSHWRKPEPGMIRAAVKQYCLVEKKSVFIGDRETDMRAAKAAGISQYVDASKRFWIMKACIMLVNNTIHS